MTKGHTLAIWATDRQTETYAPVVTHDFSDETYWIDQLFAYVGEASMPAMLEVHEAPDRYFHNGVLDRAHLRFDNRRSADPQLNRQVSWHWLKHFRESITRTNGMPTGVQGTVLDHWFQHHRDLYPRRTVLHEAFIEAIDALETYIPEYVKGSTDYTLELHWQPTIDTSLIENTPLTPAERTLYTAACVLVDEYDYPRGYSLAYVLEREARLADELYDVQEEMAHTDDDYSVAEEDSSEQQHILFMNEVHLTNERVLERELKAIRTVIDGWSNRMVAYLIMHTKGLV